MKTRKVSIVLRRGGEMVSPSDSTSCRFHGHETVLHTFRLVSTLESNQTRLKSGREEGTLRWTSSYLGGGGRGGDLNTASNFIQSTLK